MSVNILVTGANGFLASHLIPVLLRKKDIFVCGTYRNETGRLRRRDPRHLAYERCDLSEAREVARLFQKRRFYAVIHTAASISTRNDYDYLRQSLRDNMASQENLVNEALRRGCKRYIFCSSISVYGESAGKRSGFREDDAPDPRDVYGWSKYTAEELLRMKTEHHASMNSIVLRFAGIHGAGRQSGVVYNMIRAAISGEDIIINEPKSRFRFLFVDDAIEAVMRALSSKPAVPYACYNVAGEEIYTLEELAREIFEITGHSGRVRRNKGGRARNQILNIDRIKTAIGFKSKTLAENIKSIAGEIKTGIR